MYLSYIKNIRELSSLIILANILAKLFNVLGYMKFGSCKNFIVKLKYFQYIKYVYKIWYVIKWYVNSFKHISRPSSQSLIEKLWARQESSLSDLDVNLLSSCFSYFISHYSEFN